MKNKWIAGIVAVGVFAFAGCQKDPLKSLTASESRIYITNHDSTAVFSSFKTFSVADSAGVIENNQGKGKELTDYDAGVIAALKSALVKQGFTEVERTASPDLGITVSRVYSNYTGVITYPSYWNNYGNFYDPFYWGYGGYSYFDPYYYGPSFYDVYQVTQGALTIDMLDLKNAKGGNTIRPLWSALARGTGVFDSRNIAQMLSAFFNQSPYLLTN